MSEPSPRATPPIPGEVADLVARLVYLSGQEQEAALAELRGKDPALADRVARLVADERALGLHPPTQERASARIDLRADDATPQLVRNRLASLAARGHSSGDRLKVGEEVARGGMGAIYRARDEGLGRELAMKVVLQPVDGAGTPQAIDPQVLHRFLDEAQITGQLDHPGVVPVHELGVDAKGRAYFTMRLIKGKTADEVFQFARQHKDGWTQTRALEVILKVCDTLAYAHSKGVVHRDIKPTNVMVGRFGEVYVMDWGLAKVLGGDDRRDLRLKPTSPSQSQVRTDRSKQAESDPDSPLLTMDGAVVGTPSYMAPEQAEGRVELLGVRSDVYSVGTLLYTLLAGTAPYVTPSQRASPYTILRWVIEGPPRPVHDIDRSAPAELVAICGKAMARLPEQRYADTKELADDLRAFLENRVVRAHRTGAWAELRALWKRQPSSWLVPLCVVIALMVSSAMGRRRIEEKAELARVNALAASQNALLAQQREKEALHNFTLAQQREREANDNLALANKHASEARDAAEEAARKTAEARRQAYFASMAAAWSAAGRDEIASLRRFLDEAPAELRAFEWHHLDAIADLSQLVLRGHDGRVQQATFSPDGTKLLTSSMDGTARVWDTASGQQLTVVRHGDAVMWSSFSTDGCRFVTASFDRTARVVEVATSAQAILRGHSAAVMVAVFTPDASRVVTASADKTARIWDAATGKQLMVLDGHTGPVFGVDVSVDGDTVVTVSDDRTARLWSVATGQSKGVLRGHEGTVRYAAFSGDGTHVLTLSDDKTVRIWRTGSCEQVMALAPEQGGLGHRAASLDRQASRLFVEEQRDGARALDVATGKELFVLRGHHHALHHLQLSADDARLVTTDAGGCIRTWDANTGQPLAVLHGHTGAAYHATFSPDGARVASASADGTARLWDSAATARFRRVDLGAVVFGAACTPDNQWVLAFLSDGVHVLDAVTFEEIAVLPPDDQRLIGGSISCDGSRLVTFSDPHATLWDTASWQPTGELAHRGSPISTLSPDGKRLAVVTDKTLTLVDTESLAPVLRLRPHSHRIEEATFSRDGTAIATVSRLVNIWDTGSGKLRAACRASSNRDYAICTCVSFDPSGERLAGAHLSGPILIWNAESGDIVCPVQTDSRALGLSFNHDGSRLLAALEDRTVRIWETTTWREVAVLGCDRLAFHAMFSPGDTRVLATTADGLLVWDTVSNHRRFQEQAASRAAVPAAQHVVDSLRREHADYRHADAALLARGDLDQRVHRAARNLLLQRSAEPRAAAWQLVRQLQARLAVGAEVIQAVDSDPTLSDATRAHALRFAAAIPDDVEHLNRRAWNVVIDASGSPESYGAALRAAAQAMAQAPDDTNVLNTLAAALYRNGMFAEAKVKLLRSIDLRQQAGRPSHAADLAFLAMVHARLGETEAAARTLADLDRALTPELRQNDAYRALCSEARAVVEGR